MWNASQVVANECEGVIFWPIAFSHLHKTRRRMRLKMRGEGGKEPKGRLRSKLLYQGETTTEPVFVNLLRSPGIDSQPGGPVWQPYLSYQPNTLHRLVVSIRRNRFLGPLNVYKYGLWIRHLQLRYQTPWQFCRQCTVYTATRLNAYKNSLVYLLDCLRKRERKKERKKESTHFG